MTLPAIVARLLRPGAYPERPGRVEFRQTHISYLFFTPRFVYKVKKPVDFGFLDFTTLEKRLHFCREEVRLNRRLAPGVYVGVVPVTKDGRGLLMEGTGRPVEYAVKMKRLKRESMLDFMLEEGTATPALIKKVARAISAFHKKAERGPEIDEYGSIETIRKNTSENFSQTRPFVGRTIAGRRLTDIRVYTNDFLASNRRLFEERIKKGFIRDCHGDIHSEHVSISGGISIFDCIEFTPRFRCSDIVADSAFLSMDLEFRSRGDLARAFDDAYFKSSGDGRGKSLLDFYRCYRAFVRGKVEGFRLDEPEESEEDKRAALLSAIRYFRLSHLHATGGYRPMMMLVCGLSGTGKSAVARAIKAETGMAVISSDAVRKGLFKLPAARHCYGRFEAGIYSKEAAERTYRELIKMGGECLKDGRDVILDATFSKRAYIDAARKEAKKRGAFFCVILCTAPERIIKKRMQARLTEKGAISDATWEVYKRQKKEFERMERPDVRLAPGMADAPPDALAEEVIKLVFYKNP